MKGFLSQSGQFIAYNLQSHRCGKLCEMEMIIANARVCVCVFGCVQEVEYVKEEAKMVYLLECLQKTPPPVSIFTCFDSDIYQTTTTQTCRMLQNITFSHWQVLIFAEKKADVDAIHEYLLLKGVEAVAIHGGKGLQNLYSNQCDTRQSVCSYSTWGAYVCMEECQSQCPKPLHAHSLFFQHPCSCSSSPPDVTLVADVTTSASQLHHISMEVATDAFIMFPFVIVLQKIVFCGNICCLFFRPGGKNKSHRGVQRRKERCLSSHRRCLQGSGFPSYTACSELRHAWGDRELW